MLDLFKTSEMEKTKEILKAKEEQKKQEIIAKNKALCGCGEVSSPTSLSSSDIKSSDGQIKSWNYVPNKMLFGQEKKEQPMGKLFMGFELEVEGGGEEARHALNIKNIIGDDVVYTVHDGSLSKGFEIVTHPQTLAKHKINAYKKGIDYLLKNNYKDESSHSGLHIHINRDFFGIDKTSQQTAIAKLCILIENNWNFIKKVSRRDTNEYSQRLDPNVEYKNDGFALIERSKRIGKYACVNLEHSATVEFRMFKGTLKYENLMMSLELINNLGIIAKNTDIQEIKNIKYDDIVNISECPYLKEFCRENRMQF